jgi:hypothetical protein
MPLAGASGSRAVAPRTTSGTVARGGGAIAESEKSRGIREDVAALNTAEVAPNGPIDGGFGGPGPNSIRWCRPLVASPPNAKSQNSTKSKIGQNMPQMARLTLVSAVPARVLPIGAARWSPRRYHFSTPKCKSLAVIQTERVGMEKPGIIPEFLITFNGT